MEHVAAPLWYGAARVGSEARGLCLHQSNLHCIMKAASSHSDVQIVDKKIINEKIIMLVSAHMHRLVWPQCSISQH